MFAKFEDISYITLLSSTWNKKFYPESAIYLNIYVQGSGPILKLLAINQVPWIHSDGTERDDRFP